MQAGLGAGNPAVGGSAQQIRQMPTEKLHELAARFPPNSQQGSMVQAILRQRQMNPQSDPGMQPQGLGAMPGMAAGGGLHGYATAGGVDDPYSDMQPDASSVPTSQYGTFDPDADPTPVRRFMNWMRSGAPVDQSAPLPGSLLYSPPADVPPSSESRRGLGQMALENPTGEGASERSAFNVPADSFSDNGVGPNDVGGVAAPGLGLSNG